MDDSVVIALFRHGLTEANRRHAYLGWTDSPLCAEAEKLTAIREYQSHFSSDLQRCITTAQIIFPRIEPIQLKELREMNFGAWEGKTYEELREEAYYRQWISDPMKYKPPGGESFSDFAARVQAGWGKMIHHVLTSNHQRIAVVTHGGVIRYLLSQFAPEPLEFWSWQVQHNQSYELIFSREALRRGERCTSLLAVPLTAKEPG